DTIGSAYVQVDLEELYGRIRRYALTLLSVLCGALSVAFLLATGLMRVISEPIKHLVDVARCVSSDKNYSVRASKHGNDELGLLVDAFNEMLSQIQGRD